MRNVGDRKEKLTQALVQLGNALVGLLDCLGNLLHFREQLAGVAARALDRHDFVAGLIAVGLHPFGRGNQRPAFGVDLAKLREIDGNAAIPRHLFDRIQVFAKKSKVKHKLERIHQFRNEIMPGDSRASIW